MKLFLVTAILLSTFCMNGQTIDSVSIKQVDSLIKVSKALISKQDYEKAQEINADAEKIALEKLGRYSAEYAKSCFNKGLLYFLKGKYVEAEKWYLESKEIREKVFGKAHPDYAWCLNNLANLYITIGDFEKAESLHLEAKTIREKALGKEHRDYARSLNNLATLYFFTGNYEKAEPLYLEAKNIREKTLGKENPDYAGGLNNLASLYSRMGNYEKAEPFFIEAKNIQEKTLGKENSDYAGSLNNLAILYENMGNYEKAESLYLESKAISEKVFGNEHPDHAISINNLASLYLEMGNYEKAAPLFLEAKNIKEKTLGKENPEYAGGLTNLGILYYKIGNFEVAELMQLEALAIKEKILGKEHPDYGLSLNNLANIYSEMGKHEKAEQIYLNLEVILNKAFGDERPLYAIENLSDLYAVQKRFSELEPLLIKKMYLEQAKISDGALFLSERELASYISTFQKNGDRLGAYMLDLSSAKALYLNELYYNHVLFQKGFLLYSAARLNTAVLSNPESEAINLRLKGYRRRLATEYSKPISERKAISELEEKANDIEKELARFIVGYVEAARQVKWQEVQRALKKGEAAIEFLHFKVNFPVKTDSSMYAVLLLKPGIFQPKFIPLFEEKSLDSILQTKGERRLEYVNDLYTFSSRGVSPVQEKRRSLVELIFKPLEKELDGITTIYYSPSGLLHRINLDAIPVSETETLADRYNLVELNSTRQLVIPTIVKNTTNDAVLFGGIRYEVDTTLLSNQPIFASKAESQLSFNQNNSQSRGGSWDYLPGTEREVNAIEKITTSGGIKTTLKKGYDGTEEAFKNIGANNASSPRILHIATHGYFFPDPKEKNSKTIFGDDEPVFKLSDHPMLRSGLIMAGGNNTWKGEKTLEGREDGVLTAYEISQMNLSNTELVILSACETGLGTIQGNEGVYGLQRAFKIAGAKYLIMSLWQVPDKQTSLLMTTFYKKWLENKMNIPDAFHAAQKELRDIGLDPYQWAGFVLVE